MSSRDLPPWFYCKCICVRVYCACVTNTWILLSMLGLKMYMPALILLETKTWGFSTKRCILPVSVSNTTTPYLEGSSTRVTFKHKQYKCVIDINNYFPLPSSVMLLTWKAIQSTSPWFFLKRWVWQYSVQWTVTPHPHTSAQDGHFALSAHHYGSLLAVVEVELQHVFEREITDDVWVEDEERLAIDIEQLSSQCQGARCAHTHKHTFIFLSLSQSISPRSCASTCYNH